MPAKFDGLVSNGGLGRIICGTSAGKIGVFTGAPLEGTTIVEVAASGSVCTPVGVVVVGIDVNCRLEIVMKEN